MHELALAEAVVAAALEVAEREGLSAIREISVRVGELQRIEREVFEFALREVLPASEPRVADARFRVATEPTRLRCHACSHAFRLSDTSSPLDPDAAESIHFIPELAHSFLCCPVCRSPDFEVIEGRGVSIERIEGS
ncbi:MAG: hydrogenase nickel incorporation protein HypA [Deltaproteobacteria bacterium]|nr:MAG: hydrogenase nickel incorporation protein HypA [Deltaproteobacteria bacterium]